MKSTPITMQALYQLVIAVALALLGYSVRRTDPQTFQMIVGALIVQTTGGTIHLGRQASIIIKGGSGNGGQA